MIGATLQREGRTLEAIAELEAARDALPTDVPIRAELSELLAKAGRLNGQLTYCGHLLRFQKRRRAPSMRGLLN